MNPILEKARIPGGLYGSTESDGFNGAFELQVNGELLRCIASDGMGWQHVSISKVGQPTKVPNWSMMCEIKNLFWGEDVWVMQFHPAKAEYVNNHAGCLHLWRPTQIDFPIPPAILVGLKGQTPEQIKATPKRKLLGLLLVDSDPSGMGGKLIGI